MNIITKYNELQKDWYVGYENGKIKIDRLIDLDEAVCTIKISLETLLCDFDNLYNFKEVVFADKEVERAFGNYMEKNNYGELYLYSNGFSIELNDGDFGDKVAFPTPQMLYKYRIDFLRELIKGE